MIVGDIKWLRIRLAKVYLDMSKWRRAQSNYIAALDHMTILLKRAYSRQRFCVNYSPYAKASIMKTLGS